jgi:hypothetical protein
MMKFDNRFSAKAIRRLAALLVALCMLLVSLAGCSGCFNKGKKDPVDAGNTATGTITITNVLGSPIANAQVYIYEDDSLAELVTFAQTDAEGKVTYTGAGDKAVAVIKGVAPGYKLDASYPLDGDTAIVLEALATTAVTGALCAALERSGLLRR